MRKDLQAIRHRALDRPLERELVDVVPALMKCGYQMIKARLHTLAGVQIQRITIPAIAEGPFQVRFLIDRRIEVHIERRLPALAVPRVLLSAGIHLICRADDRGEPVITLSPPLIAGEEEFAFIESVLRRNLTDASREFAAREGR